MRPAPDANHDRHRRREPKRTWAGDYEHGHGVDHRVRQTRLGADQKPNYEGQQRDCEHGGNKISRDFVGKRLDRRTAALSIPHHLHDARKYRVAADALRPHQEAARCVQRAASHDVPNPLLHRDRLASYHGFVNRRPAFDQNAVYRYLPARSHTQHRARGDSRQRHLALFAIIDNACGLRGEVEKRTYGAAGLGASAQFEHLAKQDEDDYHGRRFEIYRRFSTICRNWENVWRKNRHRAVNISRANADGDQREHVQMPCDDRTPTALEERPTSPQHNRSR